MTLVVRPGFTFDADASTYIEAVEAADTQALETATRYAINNFVLGCKADGIWSAIKASCILAGARTLAGALVPLVGTAPTNNNFVSGDYGRKTGLVGNGSTKYLNSNRLDSADSQNSHHLAVYLSSLTTFRSPGFYMGAAFLGGGGSSSSLGRFTGSPDHYARSRYEGVDSLVASTGLFAVTRSASGSYVARNGGVEVTTTGASSAPNSTNVLVFARNANDGNISYYSNGRIAFYSIGSSLSLALLDARVTTLIAAFGAVIP